jgi:hypothetical protein
MVTEHTPEVLLYRFVKLGPDSRVGKEDLMIREKHI